MVGSSEHEGQDGPTTLHVTKPLPSTVKGTQGTLSPLTLHPLYRGDGWTPETRGVRRRRKGPVGLVP